MATITFSVKTLWHPEVKLSGRTLPNMYEVLNTYLSTQGKNKRKEREDNIRKEIQISSSKKSTYIELSHLL